MRTIRLIQIVSCRPATRCGSSRGSSWSPEGHAADVRIEFDLRGDRAARRRDPADDRARDRLVLEAPGGLVEVVAQCRAGKAERITVRHVASFADRLDAAIEVAGLGTLTADTAYGGDSFVRKAWDAPSWPRGAGFARCSDRDTQPATTR